MSVFKTIDVVQNVMLAEGHVVIENSFNFVYAVSECETKASACVSKIFHGIGGDYEEDVFHWLVQLENGNVAHIWGSCGAYTGWEICGELRVDEYANFTDAFHDMGMAKHDVNGVYFKEIFYKIVEDKIADEEIERILKEDI